LNAVFVTEHEGKFIGTIALADLVRADPEKKVEELSLTDCSIGASADFADVTLMMADYNLTALAVIDKSGNLIGAISVDDLLEALVPDEWRNRVEASA
jgi:Mg/Co/Ni transporter MgtE